MKTRWALCVVVVASCFASRKARALAIYDPKIDRMAITDRSTAANVQPRVFLVTVGNETVGSNLLVTKDPDAIQNGWRSTNVNGVTSGLAAVSWTDGTNQRQRVFFAKDNALAMLPNDNDTQSPVVSIAPPQNYTIADTDVAAVTWLDGTTRRMVVATGAKLSGTAGYACLFENADLAPTWSVSCQSTIRTTTTKLDIVGTVVSNSAQFYFKNDAGGLGRLRRTGANATHVY